VPDDSSTREANVISNQILRSATGMAANYRAAGLARSKAEFISKLGIVVEEAENSILARTSQRQRNHPGFQAPRIAG
jgi:four helix bundle protein